MPPPNQASLDLPTTSLVPLAAAASLPAQDISAEVLLEKYAKGEEQTLEELRARAVSYTHLTLPTTSRV